VTTAELAFLVPAGVVLGAAISFVGARLTSIANMRQSRDERLFEKRADIYPPIIHAISLALTQVRELVDPANWDNGTVAQLLDAHMLPVREASSKLRAFGGPEVIITSKVYESNLALLYHLATGEYTDGDRYALLRGMVESAGKLDEALRRELQGTTRITLGMVRRMAKRKTS
jgi:hypothetical protein